VHRITQGGAALALLLAAAGLASNVHGQDCDVRGVVETPPDGGTITQQNVLISGWAADLSATSGTGIQAVRVSLDADPDQGGVPLPAQNGWERPDVAALLGSPRYSPSGFALTWDTTGVPPGQHTLYIQVRTACGWTANNRTVTVAARPGTTTSTSPATAGAGTTGAPAGSGTVTVPGGTVTVPGVRPSTTAPATGSGAGVSTGTNPATGGAPTTRPGTGVPGTTGAPGTGGVPGTTGAPGGVSPVAPAPTPFPPPPR